MTSFEATTVTIIEIGDSEDLKILIDRLTTSTTPLLLTRNGQRVAAVSPVAESRFDVGPPFGSQGPLPYNCIAEEDRGTTRAVGLFRRADH